MKTINLKVLKRQKYTKKKSSKMYECCCSKFLTTVGACSNIDRASALSTSALIGTAGGKGSLHMAAAAWAVCFGGLELTCLETGMLLHPSVFMQGSVCA